MNLWIVAKEIRRVSLAVSSEFYQRSVSDNAGYVTLTNKPTIDEVYERIEKQWENSGIEMVACAVGLMLIRNNRLLAGCLGTYQSQVEDGLA